jgi:hypothetical protein
MIWRFFWGFFSPALDRRGTNTPGNTHKTTGAGGVAPLGLAGAPGAPQPMPPLPDDAPSPSHPSRLGTIAHLASLLAETPFGFLPTTFLP